MLLKGAVKPFYVLPQLKLIFLFKGSFYAQVDGVSMGSPLAPVLANLFMGHNERDWIENYKGCVDDTFCVFERERDAVSFSNYINSQHPNIRFTMEKEVDNKLAFLDVLWSITTLLISRQLRHLFSVRKLSPGS